MSEVVSQLDGRLLVVIVASIFSLARPSVGASDRASHHSNSNQRMQSHVSSHHLLVGHRPSSFRATSARRVPEALRPKRSPIASK